MLRSSTGTTSQYEQIKLTYLNTKKYRPKYETYIRIQEDESLHALYFRESEFLNADKITPTSPKEEADLKVKKAIVKAINTNDTKTLQRLLKRSSMETKKTEPSGIPFYDRSPLARVTVNFYSLIYLANQPNCTLQTRETIYHCLTKEEDYLPYLTSFFKTKMIRFTYPAASTEPVFGLSNFHLAAALNLKNIVQQLFKQYGVRLDAGYSIGYFSTTMLGLAATFGHLEMVKFLYSTGAELNADYSLTTLGYHQIRSFITYVTLSERHDDLTRYLLDNIELKDPINFLHVAAHYNNLPILKYAFEKFQIPFSTLIEKNAYLIIFALIEAGVELPANAPDDLKTAAQLWKIDMASASTPTAATAAAAAACITTAKPDIDSISTLTSATARP